MTISKMYGTAVKKNQKSEERLFFLIDISKLTPYDLQYPIGRARR